MSEITDQVVGRYMDQNPGQREVYALDPMAHHEIELMRRTLDAADRAMSDEGVPEETRRRVVNLVVWGDPEGVVDVHARHRERTIYAYGMTERAGPLTFTCPVCLRTSSHPEDRRQGWCSACKGYTALGVPTP